MVETDKNIEAEADQFIVNALSGGILDSKAKKQIRAML